MNINLKLDGIAEQTIYDMLEMGVAKTKTEAIRLALLKYRDQLKDYEEIMVLNKMKLIDKAISEKKIKKHKLKEILDTYPEFKELL